MLIQAGLARRIARLRSARLVRQQRTLHQYVESKPDFASVPIFQDRTSRTKTAPSSAVGSIAELVPALQA